MYLRNLIAETVFCMFPPLTSRQMRYLVPRVVDLLPMGPRYRLLCEYKKRATEPDSVDVRTRDGIELTVWVPDTIGDHLVAFREWEPVQTAVLKAILRKGDTAIDLGANIGYYTTVAGSLVGPTGKVWAVEPSHTTFNRLQSNVRRNAMGQINLVEGAVGLKDEIRTLTIPVGNVGAATILDHHRGTRPILREEQVRLQPIEALVPVDQLRKARIIKIDIEGGEPDLIRHLIADHLIDPHSCAILTELNYIEAGPARKFLMEMHDLGYAVYGCQYEYDLRKRPKSFAPASELQAPFDPVPLDIALFPRKWSMTDKSFEARPLPSLA